MTLHKMHFRNYCLHSNFGYYENISNQNELMINKTKKKTGNIFEQSVAVSDRT